MYSPIIAEQLEMSAFSMYLLLTWAIVNIVGGIILSKKHKKNVLMRSFFQMNALWNIVNLVIAVGTLLYLSGLDPQTMDLRSILYTVFTFEKLLLLNAGLDIAYIAIGSYLVERGKHHKDQKLQGYGKALWLQGGFLFIFDLIMYYLTTGFNLRYSIFILF